MNGTLAEEIKHALNYEKQGDQDTAFEALNDLCLKNPQVGEVWLEYALLLDKHDKEEEAIPKYQKAIECGLTPERERIAFTCLASSYRNVGEIDNAMTTIKQVRERMPNGIVECFYALILYDAGFPAKAVATLGHALLEHSKPGILNGFEKVLNDKFVELEEHGKVVRSFNPKNRVGD